MIRRIAVMVAVLLAVAVADVDHLGADWTPANGDVVSGRHYNVGHFQVLAGRTVTITPWNGVHDTTGRVVVEANQVTINGTLDAQGRGYGGGGGGRSGSSHVGTPGGAGTNGSGGAGGDAGDYSSNRSGGGGGGSGNPVGAGGINPNFSEYNGLAGTPAAGGRGGNSSEYTGGAGGLGYGGGGGGGASMSAGFGTAGGGGGGGTGGTGGSEADGGAGGSGVPANGGAGGVGTNGGLGGYNAPGVNTDASTDQTIYRGGGGGGGSSWTNSWSGAGAGGGAGGGSIALYATGTLAVGATGTVGASGSGGGIGGLASSKIGYNGGGGGGGGILLKGVTVTLASGAQIVTQGYNAANSPQTVNGGTVKVFYCLLSNAATITAGRTCTRQLVPLKAVPASPPDGDTTKNQRPTFAWSAGGAVTYELQVSRDVGFTNLEVNLSGLGTPSYTPGTDLPERKPYWWRARGNNGAGDGDWSDVWTLSVDITAPPEPTREGPAQDTATEDTPLLDWSKSGEEDRHYLLDVKKDGSLFLQEDIPQAYGEDRSFYQFAFDALGDGVYTWTVEARDSAGSWSDPQTTPFWFAVDKTAPAVPTLVSPVGGVEIEVELPNLDWQPIPDAREFTLELYDATDGLVFSKTIDQLAGEDKSNYQLVAGEELTDLMTYTWQVKAEDYVQNQSAFCTPEAFTVDLLPDWPESWQEVRSMPASPTEAKAPKDGAWLATHEAGADVLPVIYAAKGNKSTDFYMYDPVTGDSGTWHDRAAIPATEAGRTKPPSKGCVGVSDGTQYLYMTKGNNTLGFWRYDALADKWDSMAGVPEGVYRKRVKGGTDMVFADHKDTGCVYLLKGYKTEFYRYNTLAGRWDTLGEVPYGANKRKYDKGSFLAYDETNRLIYAHQAKYYDKSVAEPNHYMFRYDVAADSWYKAALPGMPVYMLEGGRGHKKKKSADGAAGAWYGENLYALKGGNTQGFFKYFPGPDTWHQLDTVPGNGTFGKKKRVKAGGDLVSYYGGAFFILKGNKTYELWRYVESTGPAFGGSAVVRSGVQAGRLPGTSLQFAVLPNPIASGYATLTLRGPAAEGVSGRVRVFDAAGRCVLVRQLVTGNCNLATPLDLRALSSGIYLVRLDADGYSQTQKLVVQR